VIAVDSNVLVAAHRQEHTAHRKALTRLQEIAEGEAPWGLPIFCVPEFLRVVTHPRVFSPPSDLAVASSFVDRLLESPSLRLLLPGDRFWACLRAALELADARGNLVFDAQIAALCEEHGVRDLVTGDRDFSRFTNLRPEFL
jgi:toxin-antitoxin system PIN domain toxin